MSPVRYEPPEGSWVQCERFPLVAEAVRSQAMEHQTRQYPRVVPGTGELATVQSKDVLLMWIPRKLDEYPLYGLTSHREAECEQFGLRFLGVDPA